MDAAATARPRRTASSASIDRTATERASRATRYALARGGRTAAKQQLARSYLEQQIGRERRRLESCDDGGFECVDILGFLGAGYRMRQYRLVRYNAEQFSGHERGKAFDGCVLHDGPLRMGTRDADDHLARGSHAQGAKQLGFFAPHDIRSMTLPLRDPRKDPDVA